MDNGASSYRRYLEGEQDAFDEIMKEHFDGLIFFINRYLGDPALSEDIAIDVFAELIIHPKRYNFSVSLKTYLYMIGRSRALNAIKKRNRQKAEDVSDYENLLSDENELSEKIIVGERNKALYSALHSLPREMMTAVYLIYFENMTYEDAARVMKKKKKAVDNLLYRAKKELAKLLGESGIEYL